MTPQLTVCIPAYDRPDVLGEALASLCEQGLTREEFVVIVSDDNSPNNLRPVVDAFEDRLSLSYVRNTVNVGHLQNFASSFAAAATPFVTFLPHDDIVSPGHLARALRTIINTPECVLVASLVLCVRHPGALQVAHHGFFPSGPERARFGEAYQWDRTEWMALALITTPMSIVGSIFRTDVFRRCRDWVSFPVWHDRLMLAEMGRHGRVVTLPWIAGYYRVGESQLSGRLWAHQGDEIIEASKRVLLWCRDDGTPVLEFWVDRICTSTRPQRVTFLQLLQAALPPTDYQAVKLAAERRLGVRLHTSRLERLGVPAFAAEAVRRFHAGLGRHLG
jgi:glycosyltransferase involved in cell wall biosynthesis